MNYSSLKYSQEICQKILWTSLHLKTLYSEIKKYKHEHYALA